MCFKVVQSLQHHREVSTLPLEASQARSRARVTGCWHVRPVVHWYPIANLWATSPLPQTNLSFTCCLAGLPVTRVGVSPQPDLPFFDDSHIRPRSHGIHPSSSASLPSPSEASEGDSPLPDPSEDEAGGVSEENFVHLVRTRDVI